MNIVCYFISFNGIGNSRGMYGDLVCELASRGHNVYVIAPSKNNMAGIENCGNVKICWVNSIKLLNVGFIAKALANLMLPFLFLNASKKYLPQTVDMVISSTPPITLTNVIRRVKKQHNSFFYLILRDIFPQNAVDLGIMTNGGIVHKYFRRVEKKLYKLADRIGCMSQGNVDYLLYHNPELDPSKAVILPNWINVDKKYDYETSKFIAKHNLENRYIALFGGNLGIAQNPLNIVDLAELHKDKEDLVFLIIGKGIYKNKLEESIKQRGLNNIIMADHLPRDEYEALASKCNVGLVSLNGNFTIPNIPSRTLGYWQAKLPVFAIVDKCTDLGPNVIEKCNGGFWCVEGNKDQYINLFNILYSDKHLSRQMGLNGYKTLQEENSVKNATDIILNF